MKYAVRSIAPLAVALTITACSGVVDAPLPPTEVQDSLPLLAASPTPVLSPDGTLQFSANAAIYGNATTPPMVTVSVLARNVTNVAVSRTGLCVVQLRAYSDTTRARAPVWQSPAHAALSCDAPVIASIPAGAQHHVHGAEAWNFTPVSVILGNGLPAGRYTFDALVRVGADTVAVPAGTLWLVHASGPPLTDARVLRYAAVTTVVGVSPRVLVTRVVASNPTERNVYLEYGACSLQLRAYRNSERTGAPAWRSEYRSPPGWTGGYGCPAYLATALVQPGQSISPREFNLHVPLPEVLADSLPDGRYYFTAELRFLQTSGGVRETIISIPAGSADLTSQVDPLPQERSHAGIRYRASVASAGAGAAVVTLTLTNTTDQSIFITGSRSVTCATSLYGFRSAEQRDRWYAQRSADWHHASCPFALPPMWLAAGEQKAVSVTVSAQGSPGLYHLVLSLWADHVPGGDARLVLSAGSAQLD